MTKEAYYFSHDSNARHDEKILAMRSVYQGEGYGWYWVIIEMMRDANAHRLQCTGKYWHHALAQEMHTQPETALAFMNDCINEFNLFNTDGQFIWSESLRRRMVQKEKKSVAARKAVQKRWAAKRWPDKGLNTDVSKTDTIKESKGKEIKENEIKTKVVMMHHQTATPTHQQFLNRILSDEGQPEREAIEKQTRTLLTPDLLNEFLAHLTTGAKNHGQISEFNTHLRNWLNTRPRHKPPEALTVKNKKIV